MQATTAIQSGILLAVALVLILAAIEDVRTRRISNRLSIIILALFTANAMTGIVSGQDILAVAIWPLVVGISVFAVGLALFAAGLMGGGDVKLLAAVALFAGPKLGLSLVLYVTALGGLVALALLLWNRVRSNTGLNAGPNANKVPYGVAIAGGGLWVCFTQISVLSN
ncbi:MAG: prepilin peptidase [Alphaproteobacteria bacterium]|nr:prepilin peptidase [Alphaproteobacteria bacterium]